MNFLPENECHDFMKRRLHYIHKRKRLSHEGLRFLDVEGQWVSGDLTGGFKYDEGAGWRTREQLCEQGQRREAALLKERAGLPESSHGRQEGFYRNDLDSKQEAWKAYEYRSDMNQSHVALLAESGDESSASPGKSWYRTVLFNQAVIKMEILILQGLKVKKCNWVQEN